MSEVKERPILFSGAMVRAILEGRKAQTRRIAQYPSWVTEIEQVGEWWHGNGYHPPTECDSEKCAHISAYANGGGPSSFTLTCPCGVTGDRLWVRETFNYAVPSGYDAREDGGEFWYRATDIGQVDGPWRPAIFMPRRASRITLEITGVRVQRLQEIDFDDCVAEGIETAEMARYREGDFSPGVMGWLNYGPPRSYNFNLPQESYRSLWDSINGKTHPWADNPWVWAITFRKLERR